MHLIVCLLLYIPKQTWVKVSEKSYCRKLSNQGKVLTVTRRSIKEWNKQNRQRTRETDPRRFTLRKNTALKFNKALSNSEDEKSSDANETSKSVPCVCRFPYTSCTQWRPPWQRYLHWTLTLPMNILIKIPAFRNQMSLADFTQFKFAI